MKTFTKESLKEELAEISKRGFIPSHKDTSSRRNDGAAGNLLENLLGIEENNLPLPNASEWELKVQRKQTASLMSLFHVEPSPRALKFVPQVLLPRYGWPHDKAGSSYPTNELSFRQTMNGQSFTDRGFIVRREGDVLRVAFDSSKVHERHSAWLADVERKAGLGDLDPFPYWGLEDLRAKASAKLHNAFHVVADVKKIEGQEFFHYGKCEVLRGFSLEGFLDCLEQGLAHVEFDARTGHNHGTKFRIKQGAIPLLYRDHELVFDHLGAHN